MKDKVKINLPAWKVVRIKNHVPVVVTQEDVDEYGSVASAVNGRVVEAEVCNELNRIRLIKINAIGFDLIANSPLDRARWHFCSTDHSCKRSRHASSCGCCQGTGSITRGMVAML